MNIFLSIKNKKHRDKIAAYMTPSLHNHVILGIAILPMALYMNVKNWQRANGAIEKILIGVFWWTFLLLLFLGGFLATYLYKRFKKHENRVKLCLDIFYTASSGFLAWQMITRAPRYTNSELGFKSGWLASVICVAVFEVISRLYLKLIANLILICCLFIKIYFDTHDLPVVFNIVQTGLFYCLSIYFTHRDTIKRFLEKQKIHEETEIFKEVLDQTTEGILIYGLKEGEMYRNWKSKKKNWWNEQLSVTENFKAIIVEQKKTLSDRFFGPGVLTVSFFGL